MLQVSSTGAQRALSFAEVPAPTFLVPWHSWWRQFLNNIADLFRAEERPVSRTPPGEYWHDVFVDRSLPLRKMGYSAFFHASLIFFVVATGKFWLVAPAVVTEDPYQNTTLTYYKVDEFLPEIKSAPLPHRLVSQRPDPVLAKQPIISVPALVDNHEQTIMNPRFPNLITRNVPLPNLVVSTLAPAPPIAALASPKLVLPDALLTPVPPPVATRQILSKKIPELPQVVAVQPSVEVKDFKNLKVDLADLQSKVDAPKLPSPEPSVMETIRKEVAQAEPPPALAPKPASLKGLSKPAGQLMALSLHPEAPSAEVKVPNGSRGGEFAASPDGKLEASGQPQIKPIDNSQTHSGANGDEKAVAAVSITGAPLNPLAGAVVAGPVARPPNTSVTVSQPKLRVAMNAPSAMMDFSRRALPPPYVPRVERDPEDKVFAGKRIYSMQLNMPNLTSAGGSWIIRFAELKEDGHTGDLSSPVVTNKVDPAYPQDLVRDQVEGVVVLYAIIHADGSVGDVKVLQGLHDKLDENARIALASWHFRPAMKNGEPVDLEAVVQIPFKTRRTAF